MVAEHPFREGAEALARRERCEKSYFSAGYGKTHYENLFRHGMAGHAVPPSPLGKACALRALSPLPGRHIP